MTLEDGDMSLAMFRFIKLPQAVTLHDIYICIHIHINSTDKPKSVATP